MVRSFIIIAVIFGLALSPSTVRAEAFTYSVRDLGTLGGANSRAHAINEQGWVVGEAEAKGGYTRAFLWVPEQGMQDIGTCGGDISRAFAINERGQVVGEAEDGQGRLRPFRWSAEHGLEDLPLPDGFREGFVSGLNNFGVLVGGGENEAGTRALVWSVDGVSIPEALVAHGASLAHAVNDVGDIAGQMESAPSGDYVSRAFVLGANGLNILSAPASKDWSSAALALSADGMMAGYAEDDEATHAVRISHEGIPSDMDTLDNVYSIANDMNDNGVAVGLFVSSNEDDDRAFVARDGVMSDLNELIETDEPWLIVEARGINNQGAIVGYALLGDRERAVLLEPRASGPDKRPTINIVEPKSGAQFTEGEAIALEAAVQPADRNVKRVTFFSSGVVLGSVTSAPYRLVWENPPPGPHHLVAAVASAAGRIRRSARVHVQVQVRDRERPVAVILEPDDGTALALGEPLRIVSEAVALDRTPLTIRLFLDGAEMAVTNGFSADFEWRPEQTGLFTWVSIVTDLQGDTTTSAAARVHVTVPE